MDTISKNEKLKFIIERYDKYYENINSKGNVYLTINTFILAGTIAGFYTLNDKFHFGAAILLMFFFSVASNFCSVGYTLLAIKPHLNTKNDNADGSALFFGDVADYHANQYENIWRDMNDEIWHKDIKKQACLLATGLKKKFNLLVYATWFIGAQLFFIATFGIILLNYKIN